MGVVWMVARYRPGYGLSATAHLTKKAAIGYLRYLYPDIPSYLADSDVLGWIGANHPNDAVMVDYDDPRQEP
ncbi:hypothetical protein MycrhDRAFT_5735 [Mycolicibacterium rhodesiae JS60]|nr:hypothetical protein MycrhDRAFT_5735 [Mycolicibacterium rhodesiae JS60]